MATTYTLISSQVLGSSTASVTFSSIPQTYTDLVLRTSIRDATAAGTMAVYFTLNGDSASNYSTTYLYGNGSSAGSSSQGANGTNGAFFAANEGGSYTASTFASSEMYFANYTSTAAKPISSFEASENNATAAQVIVDANLYRGTSGISTINLLANTGFVANSSFYLYGIKNS